MQPGHLGLFKLPRSSHCSAGWETLWGDACTALLLLHLCPAMRKEKGNQLSRGMQRFPRQELIQEKAKYHIHIYTRAHKDGG